MSRKLLFVLLGIGLLAAFIVVLSLMLLQYDNDRYATADELLPMTFAHTDHARQQCVSCHHNYLDNTGFETCLHCHQNSPDVTHLIEQQFHQLCMGCHLDTYHKGEKSGPLRQCKSCHMADHQP